MKKKIQKTKKAIKKIAKKAIKKTIEIVTFNSKTMDQDFGTYDLEKGTMIIDKLDLVKGFKLVLTYAFSLSPKTIINTFVEYKGKLYKKDKIYKQKIYKIDNKEINVLSVLKDYYKKAFSFCEKITDTKYQISLFAFSYLDHFINRIAEKNDPKISDKRYMELIENDQKMLNSFFMELKAIDHIGKAFKLEKTESGKYIFPTKNIKDDKGNVIGKKCLFDIDVKHDKKNNKAFLHLYKNKM